MAEVFFTSNLSTALRGTEEAARRALEIIGGMAETHAKEIVPVDTGRLKNSITHEVEGDGRAVVIGTNVEYAPFVELGTVKMSARPYLRPAVENYANDYNNVIETEFRNG